MDSEEARHQGYSRSEMEEEMQEGEKRISELGCIRCRYIHNNSVTCQNVFDDEELYKKCPYFKEKEV